MDRQLVVVRAQRAARLRDYFELQLRLADRLTELTATPRGETALRFTNLHRRFGLGRAGEAPSAEWRRYAEGLESLDRFGDRLDWTVSFFAEAPDEPPEPYPFGCFSFEPPGEDGAVRIHFHNRDSADDTGPLARHKAPARRAELAAMFDHVRRDHPSCAAVRGGSWLYNLEAYRRLFPPEFAASRSEPAAVRLDGTSSWGQFLDHREGVKPGVRDAFMRNLPLLDPAAPWQAFPLRALVTRAPMACFQRFFDL